MKFLLLLLVPMLFFFTSADAQEQKNPSLTIETKEIPANEFNRIGRDAPITELDHVHDISWQVTIDNNLLYGNPDGNAVRSSSDLVISDGPVFTTTSLPNGEANTSYSQNIDVTGDSAVTIGTTVISGALPSGVTIGSTTNPSGSTYRAVISGTLPSVASETQYSFTVRATDAQNQTTDQAFTITSEVGITNSGGFC